MVLQMVADITHDLCEYSMVVKDSMQIGKQIS